MIDRSRDGQHIRIRDIEVFKTNFAGLEERRDGRVVNSEGSRYFLAWLDEDDARELEEEGWRIKWTKPRPDGEYSPRAYMNIAVSYPVNFPKLHPKVVLISGNSKTELREENVEQLDFETIIKMNVEFRGRKNPETGSIKAYAATVYAEVQEDPFASDYEDIE